MAAEITIITGYGDEFGSGHYQRMLLLAQKLSADHNINFISKNSPNQNYDFINICTDVPENTDLIIRDKRDSNPDDIEPLKKISKVVVVDDNGEGSLLADKKIDLLVSPDSDNSIYKEKMLLYGYYFYKSNLEMQNENYKKDIDVLYYHAFSERELKKLRSVFRNKDIFIIKDGCVYENDISRKTLVSENYIECLLRAKVLVSHFGIMPYEAKLCNSEVVFINPSDYHSSLSDIFCKKFGGQNLGTYSELPSKTFPELNDLFSKKYAPASSKKILNQITENLDRFVDFISVYL